MDWLEKLIAPALGLIGTAAATGLWVALRRSVRWARLQGDRIGATHEVVGDLYAELNEQGAALRILLQNGSYGAFTCDVDGYNTDVNEVYCRMVGALRRELLGRGWENYVDPDERARYEAEWEPAMAHSRDFTCPLTFRHRDGHPVQTKIRTVKLVDRDGEVVGYTGFVSEIDPAAPLLPGL